VVRNTFLFFQLGVADAHTVPWVVRCPREYDDRRFINKGDMSTRTQGTDPRVALGV